MSINKYLYSFVYDYTESELAKLESKNIFNAQDQNKLLNTDVRIKPSSSAFIKNRVEIMFNAGGYSLLIQMIEHAHISTEDFKVEYLVLEGDVTEYSVRLEKLKDIGYRIEGNPDYYRPKITYALCYYKESWCFGLFTKNKYKWYKHKRKPFSFSNSININIAKSLVNIASKGNRDQKLLDACCGVGTIMLEACFAGFNIEGSDINWKVCRSARKNIAHFNYVATVHRSDLKDLDKKYDAAIVDLPYNLFSISTENKTPRIIDAAAMVADRLVIVSISDIAPFVTKAGFRISDSCEVFKRGNDKFVRKIWVCEKML